MRRNFVPSLVLAVLMFATTAMIGGLQGCSKKTSPTAPTSSLQQIDRQPKPASIGVPRDFVRNECWYAIDRSWLTKPYDPQGPAGKSAYGKTGLSWWNYLGRTVEADANANALRYVLSERGGWVSNVIPGVGGMLSTADQNKYALQLSDPSYGLNGAGLGSPWTSYQGVGHGTQCVTFAEMIIYRATGGQKFSWPQWSTMYANRGSYASATAAVPGDLVFYVYPSVVNGKTVYLGHVAVCVIKNSAGIEVVDSNYILGDGSEAIGRHAVSNALIAK